MLKFFPLLLLAVVVGCTPFKDEGPVWPYPTPPDTSYPPSSYPGPGQRQPAPPTQPQARPPAPPRQAPSPEPSRNTWPSARDEQPRFARNEREGSGAAVISLLDKSEAEERDGRYENARAALERALRIEPRNPFLWNRLAAIRLRHGDVQQAEQLARKSNSLSGGNPWVTSRNWSLIATALEQMGDRRAARDARHQAAEANRQKNRR